MTRRIHTVIIAFVVAGLAACSGASEPGLQPLEAAAPPIQRCVNLGNALEAPREGEWGYRIREQDLLLIEQAGFDSVRLPVKWSAHAADTPPYTLDPAILNRVESVVDTAISLGLFVVLDVHHYNELMEDPETHTPRLVAMWTQIADRFVDYPDSLIFEIINEPHGALMTPGRIDSINAEVHAVIRVRSPERWIVVGGGEWGWVDGLLKTDPPIDSRTMATFHHYGPYEFTHQGAEWLDDAPPAGAVWGTARERAQLERMFDLGVDFRDRTGLPIFLGEFGVVETADLRERAEWTSAVREAAEARDFAWCHWDYAAAFPLYDIEAEQWIQPMLDALLPATSP